MSKTIVITGASSGIGEALAYAFAKRGDKLVLAARSFGEIERVRESCEKIGGSAIAIQTDVSDQEQCRSLISQATDRFGGIDILVNNAGISMRARVDEVTDLSLFERLMKVNYLGSVYCTHYALSSLKKSRGLVVAISSLTGLAGVPTRSGYAASKHAMQGFFDSLRIELADSGVDVLVACPGLVDTPIRAHMLGANGHVGEWGPRPDGSMSLEECTSILLRAIDRRSRSVVMTRAGKMGQWVKLIAPKLVDKMAAKIVKASS